MVAYRSPKPLVKVQILTFVLNSASLMDRTRGYGPLDMGSIPMSSINNNHFGEGGISPCESLRKTSRDRHLLIRITG